MWLGGCFLWKRVQRVSFGAGEVAQSATPLLCKLCKLCKPDDLSSDPQHPSCTQQSSPCYPGTPGRDGRRVPLHASSQVEQERSCLRHGRGPAWTHELESDLHMCTIHTYHIHKNSARVGFLWEHFSFFRSF